MRFEEERKLSIEFMEVIRWAEEEYGFELDASKEVEFSKMLISKIPKKS